MAYSYVWPPGLPQSPQKGFSETGGVILVRTPQDKGPAKVRYRGQKPSILNLRFIMSTTQVTTFENFVRNTIKGTARFGFTHPRTQTVVEARIVSQGDGDLYTLTYLAPGYWDVTIQFEILP